MVASSRSVFRSALLASEQTRRFVGTRQSKDDILYWIHGKMSRFFERLVVSRQKMASAKWLSEMAQQNGGRARSTGTMVTHEPETRRWMRSEYYRMGELGLFQDQRVELIDGEILTMNPQGPRHATAIQLVCDALHGVFGSGYWVRVQMPLHLGDDSAPEPDISVVRGSPREYDRHPETAIMVVEVSDTTLEFDRNHKQQLYANAGIAEYWIVNLKEHCIEVFRCPDTGRYGMTTIVPASGALFPLAWPSAQFIASHLLP